MADDRSGKQIIDDIAQQTNLRPATVERLVRQTHQREILTEGVNQKMARTFDDPLEIPGRPQTETTPKSKLRGHQPGMHFYTEKKLPEWDEFQSKVFSFNGSDDRAQFAAQAIKDGRHGLTETNPTVIELQNSPGVRDALAAWVDWAESDKPYVIEKPQGTSWHKVQAAFEAKTILLGFIHKDRGFDMNTLKIGPDFDPYIADEPQLFLVEHNWAAAFEGAKDFADGEFPLPFEHCAFEFRLNGRRVILVTRHHSHTVISEIGLGWWLASAINPLDELVSTHRYASLYGSVRALSIALDAEVAVTEVIRAPHRLNHQRDKQGKKPILDHHVINLARRSRVEALPSAGDHEAKWHPRLHFRRGHWRHFENHKTWVRWCLVGDPDLGFIDKEYRA